MVDSKRVQTEKTFEAIFQPFDDRQDDSTVGCCGLSALVALAAPAGFYFFADSGLWTALLRGGFVWVLVTFAVGMAVMAWHGRLTRAAGTRFDASFPLGSESREIALDLLRAKHANGATSAKDLLQRLGVAEETLDSSGPTTEEVLDEVVALEPRPAETRTETAAPDGRPPALRRTRRQRDFIPLRPTTRKEDDDG